MKSTFVKNITLKKLLSAFLGVTVTAAAFLLLSSCSGKIIEKRDESSLSSPASESENAGKEAVTDVIADPIPEVPEYFSPLTGLGISKDLYGKRPVAVMINNIAAAMPQEGTSAADVIYECIVEAAQTRLMALYLDYSSVPVIGSVRSSREYFLDFAENHDAIYVHAGGSSEAYKQIKNRKINNLDGVNMYLPDVFYRDAERLKTHAYEHTLMTTGEKIKSGIEYKGYRTDVKENFVSPFNFVEYGTVFVPDGDPAGYVGVTYASYARPYFIYNDETGVYDRYQFDEKQLDNTNGQTLSFENVILIYCPTFNTNDQYGHYNVNDIGTGDGFYFTKGRYIKIKWKKDSASAPVEFYTEDGETLLINRGKTFVQVCTDSMKDTTVISDGTQNG